MSAFGEGKADAEAWPWREVISRVSCESVLFNIPVNDLGEGEKDLQGMFKYEDEKVEG